MILEKSIIPSIVTQYSDESASMWLQRSAAVRKPGYDLEYLAQLDNRIGLGG